MLTLSQRQTLHQRLSPQQVQYLKMLQLPVIALEQRIKQELEANPMLEELSEVTQETKTENLYVASANPDLVGAEIELVDMPHREYRLKSAIASIAHKYDYILIDCPPSLGLLTLNALTAADSFLVPLQCEYYALEGLSQLLNTAGIIKKNLNPGLHIEGIALTMFDVRNNLSHQVVTEIRNHFADKVFGAVIPRNVRLSEAPSHGQSIFKYDPKSIGATKYMELAIELDERVQKASQNKNNPSIVGDVNA